MCAPQTQKRHLRPNLHPFDTHEWMFTARNGIVDLRLNQRENANSRSDGNPSHSGPVITEDH